MSAKTLGQRLKEAMDAAGLIPAGVAAKAGTTEATISNWLHDSVSPENVKAAMLFAIADAVRADPRHLLSGARGHRPQLAAVAESPATYNLQGAEPSSQPVQLGDWKIAFQLVAEALGDNLALPPDKHAEVVFLTHELLEEGMPRAKVLRFVRTAAA